MLRRQSESLSESASASDFLILADVTGSIIASGSHGNPSSDVEVSMLDNLKLRAAAVFWAPKHRTQKKKLAQAQVRVGPVCRLA